MMTNWFYQNYAELSLLTKLSRC